MTNCLALVALVLAVVQPQDLTKRVHDYSAVLPAAEAAELETLCQRLEADTTAQFAIVTVPSLDGLTVEEYANELFNDWGIGRRDLDNGVLLLIAPNERRMRIEVGRGIEPLLTDSLCGEIRDDFIIPAFKRDELAVGIRDGAREIDRILRENREAARGVPNSAPQFVHMPRREARLATWVTIGAAVVLFALSLWAAYHRAFSSWYFFIAALVMVTILGVAIAFVLNLPQRQQPWGWLGGAIAASGAALWSHWRKYARYGPRGCSKCGTALERLGEEQDDEYLSDAQKLEEKIGSVDYDVWYCPACLHADTERYVSYFSGYGDCPSCKSRTFKEGPQQTIQMATTYSTGVARVEGRCVRCNKKTVRTVILPRISTSSSSSGSSFGGGGGGGGSSFGGGSSGGGGASGGW
ncbi:MAG: TPM domain-containing protein [Pirellulales bacterium]|nr:TPM domain-containing protein [Pirellulales bacterium]